MQPPPLCSSKTFHRPPSSRTEQFLLTGRAFESKEEALHRPALKDAIAKEGIYKGFVSQVTGDGADVCSGEKQHRGGRKGKAGQGQ